MTEVSEEQREFCERHSTAGAIRLDEDTVMNERVEQYVNHRYVLLVMFDVKNAFNSDRWDDLLLSLK